jgi:hypothetical protein
MRWVNVKFLINENHMILDKIFASLENFDALVTMFIFLNGLW